MIEALAHESASVRLFHAGQALVQLGQPAILALEQALLADQAQVRIAAACILYQIEPTRFSTLQPHLNEALQSGQEQVIADALHLLMLAEAEDWRSVVPALLAALRSTYIAYIVVGLILYMWLNITLWDIGFQLRNE